MNEVEGMARTMYWLEVTLNQGKLKSDWEEQPEEVKDEWRQNAKSVLNLTKGGV